jgi:aryl-alcohol dehydrogenase-like predicted oxidoreductase
MQYGRLGRTGLVVSRIGLGMMSIGDTSRRAWHLTAEQAEPLRYAVEAGVTLFDTADMYDRGASEEATGALLRRLFPHRDDYVLATKVYFPLRDGVTNAGVGVLPFSPLARGLLTGSRNRTDRTTTVRGRSDPLADATYGEGDFDVVDALVDVAAGRGVPPAQVALAWLASRPGVTAPIVGATKIAHVADAVASVAVTLDRDEVARLEAPYRPHPVLGHD